MCFTMLFIICIFTNIHLWVSTGVTVVEKYINEHLYAFSYIIVCYKFTKYKINTITFT